MRTFDAGGALRFSAVRGVYPGSFNPPTVAHLAIAEAAVEQCGLERLEVVISLDTLGKDDAALLPLAQRIEMLERAARSRPWLAVATTSDRLIADIAAGYDVIVVGADKWAQVIDPAWYGDSTEARDRAVGRLPRVAVAPRHGSPLPEITPGLTVLQLDAGHHGVSASAVRDGRHDWLLPEALDVLRPSDER